MGKKGEETRQMIQERACTLFAEKGFKEVTMQDICERTGLSRGGLYRHYSGTEEIFADIVGHFLQGQNKDFSREIENNTSAVEILDKILAKYREEMLDANGSLSVAIYEYFSNCDWAGRENLLEEQYRESFQSWNRLFEYGMNSGAFLPIEAKKVFDLLIFSYQGVRMYSQIMQVREETVDGILTTVRDLIVKK